MRERVSVYVHECMYTCICAHLYMCVHFIPVITDLFLATVCNLLSCNDSSYLLLTHHLLRMYLWISL